MTQVQGPGGGHSWFSSLGEKISQAWSKVSQAVGRVFSSIPPKSGDETKPLLSPKKTGKEGWHYEYARKEVEALEQELKDTPLKPSEREDLIQKIAANALQKKKYQKAWEQDYAQAKTRVNHLVRKGGKLYHLPKEHKEALIQLIAIHNRLGGKPPTEDIHESIFLGKTGEVITLDIKKGEAKAMITLPYGEIIGKGGFGKVLKPLILEPRKGEAPIICKMGISKEEKVAKEKEVAKLKQEIAELKLKWLQSTDLKNKEELFLQLRDQLAYLNERSADEEASLNNEKIVMKALYSGREEGEEIPGIPPPYTFVQRTTQGKDMQETTASSSLLYATYYNQGSLADARKKRSFPQDLLKQYDMMLQLAQGMAYAHGKFVFLRDIKQENVLLNDKGEVVFTDFGASVCTSEEARQEKDWEIFDIGTEAYLLAEDSTYALIEGDKIKRLNEQIQRLDNEIQMIEKELAETEGNPKPKLVKKLERNRNALQIYHQELQEALPTFNQLNAQMDTYSFCIMMAEIFLGKRLNVSGKTKRIQKIEKQLQEKGVDAEVIEVIKNGMNKRPVIRPIDEEIIEALQAAKKALSKKKPH